MLEKDSNQNMSRLQGEVKALVERSERKFFDAHTHLDRANTLNEDYYAHVVLDPWDAATKLSLQGKRDLLGYLHTGIAYQPEELERRMREGIESRINCGLGRIDTCIDTTPDIGLTAFQTALKLKEEFRGKVELRIGAYPLFGFRKPWENPDRLNLFKEAAKEADFVCGLPERDDTPDRVGFIGHTKIILETAIELGIPAHFHVDQANDPSEKGTETIIEAVKWLGSPRINGSLMPSVWTVHSISPSAYHEDRFWKMVERLRSNNIGVICCPRAAISMRQYRNIQSPTHNSIARVLEMLLAGVWVLIGTDNVGDVLVPTGMGDINQEIEVLADQLRFYSPAVFYRLAVGDRLNESDREIVRNALTDHYAILKEKEEDIQNQKRAQIPLWALPRF